MDAARAIADPIDAMAYVGRATDDTQAVLPRHSAVEREVYDYAAQFSQRPRKLQVRLFDVNGTHGGLDKGCLAYAQMSGGRTVLVATDIDSDMYRAIPAAFASSEVG